MLSIQDYECPICLLLLYDPVQLNKCKHRFCLDCLSNLLDFNDDQFKCPICRQSYENYMFKVNEEIKETIIKYFGPQYNLRQQDIVKVDNKKIKLKLQYGNLHSKLNTQTSNQHQWTAFVKLVNTDPRNQIPDTNQLIKRVVFNLHETFHPRQVILLEQPFKVTRLGWGTFEIDTLVQFHPQFKIPDTNVKINLSFESDITKSQQPIYLDNNQEFKHNIDQFFNKQQM